MVGSFGSHPFSSCQAVWIRVCLAGAGARSGVPILVPKIDHIVAQNRRKASPLLFMKGNGVDRIQIFALEMKLEGKSCLTVHLFQIAKSR